MKYLFFDIECCDGAHICEFGYVLTNDKFEILDRDFFLINPEKEFNLTGRKDQRDLQLHFSEEEYYNSPLFAEYYERIKNLIEAKDQLVIGHAVSNDAGFLRTACRIYKRPPINFEFYDSQKMYSEFFNNKSSISLENAAEKLHLEKVKYLHKSDDDALLTMTLVRSMCELMELPLEQFVLLCSTSKGESKWNKIHYFSEDFNEIVKAIATSKRWISNAKKDKCIKKFIEKVKPRSAIINSALTGKKICFSPVFEREETILCLKLIQLIVNHGGIYNTKVSENQYYVKDDADDPEKHRTRYHHFVEVMDENQKQKVISYDDLLGILKTSWKELENMDFPELPKEGREMQEESNRSIKGTTIGEILAARGILLKPDQAK